jgi:DNA-binding Lrp family transcriptional regulator
MPEINLLSRKILRELCSDSRITITELARKLEVSRPVITRHIEAMERELGLRYTLALNYNSLGFTKMHLYHITFSKKPSDEAVLSFLEKSDQIQLAIKTKGDFDLVMFVLSGDEEEHAKWNLSIALEFAKYGVEVNKSDVDIVHHGFIPIDEKTLAGAKIDNHYRKMLLVLNENSRVQNRTMAKRLGLHEEMVRYYMSKLGSSGIVRRFTTVITTLPPQCANVLFFARYIYREGHVQRIYDKRKLVYFKKEQQLPVCNDYQMVLSISGGEQDFAWGTASTVKEALEERVGLHAKIFRKDSPSIRYGIVEKVLKGYMPMRSVDIKARYRTTQWGSEPNYIG